MSRVLNPTADAHPPVWPRLARLKRAFATVVTALGIVAQAVAEARELQRAVRKRYPSVGE
jgi:hypothetical protein